MPINFKVKVNVYWGNNIDFFWRVAERAILLQYLQYLVAQWLHSDAQKKKTNNTLHEILHFLESSGKK